MEVFQQLFLRKEAVRSFGQCTSLQKYLINNIFSTRKWSFSYGKVYNERNFCSFSARQCSKKKRKEKPFDRIFQVKKQKKIFCCTKRHEDKWVYLQISHDWLQCMDFLTLEKGAFRDCNSCWTPFLTYLGSRGCHISVPQKLGTSIYI